MPLRAPESASDDESDAVSEAAFRAVNLLGRRELCSGAIRQETRCSRRRVYPQRSFSPTAVCADRSEQKFVQLQQLQNLAELRRSHSPQYRCAGAQTRPHERARQIASTTFSTIRDDEVDRSSRYRDAFGVLLLPFRASVRFAHMQREFRGAKGDDEAGVYYELQLI